MGGKFAWRGTQSPAASGFSLKPVPSLSDTQGVRPVERHGRLAWSPGVLRAKEPLLGKGRAVANETNPPAPAGGGGTLSRGTISSGATKVFREFKWGLLTLFFLMVVVIALVYDGGRKKEAAQKRAAPAVQTAGGAAGSGAGGVTGLPRQEGQPPAMPGGNSILPSETPVNSGPGLAAGPGSAGRASTGPGLTSDPALRLPEVPSGPPTYAPRLTEAAPPSAPPGTPSAAAPKTEGTYAVQPGDTLEGIARKLFPNRVHTGMKALVEANQVSNPNHLRTGATLKVPVLPPPTEKKASESSSPARDASRPAPEKAKDAGAPKLAEPVKVPKTGAPADEEGVYLVQAGDSLERIARRVLKDGRRWRDLYEWNRDQLPEPGVLHVGQKLKIKPAAETPVEVKEAKPPSHPVKKEARVAAQDGAGERTPKAMDTSPTAPVWMP